MAGFIYLYKRTTANRIKKALKRPATYILAAVIVFYVIMIFMSFSTLIRGGGLNTADNLATVLSVIILMLIPSNIISYARRRGLLFRPAEVHFVFSSPVSPKMVLMFAGVKSFAMNILVGAFLMAAGIIWFEVSVWQMLLYFLFFVVFESILEASIIIFCYGNEKLGAGFFKGLTTAMFALMGVVVGVAAFLMVTRTPSFALVNEYLAMPVIQMIPVVGWNIAAVRLIFTGADTVNVIGTLLYLASVLGMFVAARKMKCTGAFYEDAMKFADDYQRIRENQKKGIISKGFGKKQKFKEATVEYKGVYGKAIYYRQMLEYKKSPTFIFGWNTLLSLGIGILIAAVGYFNDSLSQMGMWKIFIIPGAVSYIAFIFSGYATKWSKELDNPYTYLIPDVPLKKLWYATKIEHMRSAVDGILITLPGAVVLGIGPVMAILTILLYVCLLANRLYYNMLADAIVGNSLGNTGRSMVKLLFQGIAIGIGVTAAAVGGIFLGIEAGFFIMILIMSLLTFAGAAIASISFGRMEVAD